MLVWAGPVCSFESGLSHAPAGFQQSAAKHTPVVLWPPKTRLGQARTAPQTPCWLSQPSGTPTGTYENTQPLQRVSSLPEVWTGIKRTIGFTSPFLTPSFTPERNFLWLCNYCQWIITPLSITNPETLTERQVLQSEARNFVGDFGAFRHMRVI